MKYYIATKLENHAQHTIVRDKLLPHQLTYDWTVHGPVWQRGKSVIKDVSCKEHIGTVGSDLLIALLPGGRGTHVEIGMALAAGVPTMIYSTNEHHFEAHEDTCAFYHHPMVIYRTTDLECLITNALKYLVGEFLQ